jgi:hypothetical protein
VSGVYLLVNNGKLEFMTGEVNKYGELIDFCEIKKQTGNDLYYDCYAFLESETTDEKGINCIKFVTPYFDEEGPRLDMQICEKKEKIVWENPYSNYSLHIPVVMTFKYKKSLFHSYKFESLNIELMEDEKAFELWDLVDILEGSLGYKAFRWSGHKLTEELGYSVTGEVDPNDEESFVPNGLVIYSTRIKSYQVEGNKILLEMEAFIDERFQTISFTTEEFSLLENIEGGDRVVVNASNIAEVDLDAEYQAIFKFKEKGLIPEGFIEEQLALLAKGDESSLLFEMITVVDEK